MDRDTNLRWAYGEMVKACVPGFYGKVVVIVEDGEVIHLVQEKAKKPPSFYNKEKKLKKYEKSP